EDDYVGKGACCAGYCLQCVVVFFVLIHEDLARVLLSYIVVGCRLQPARAPARGAPTHKRHLFCSIMGRGDHMLDKSALSLRSPWERGYESLSCLALLLHVYCDP